MPTTIPTTTSTARESLTPNPGDAYFETDTKNYIIYDGSVWRGYVNDGVSGWSGSNTYSLNFDGTDDYLTGSPVTPTAQQGTISAWVKVLASQNGGTIFAWSNIDYNPPIKTTRPQLSILSSGELDFLYQQQHSGNEVNRIKSTSTVNDGDWHHVAVTSDGSSWSLYIDGSAASTTIPAGTNTGQWVGDIYNINPAFVAFSDIGAARRHPSVGAESYFQGNIDEVAVWDSALSAAQINNIYKGESDGGSGGTERTPGNLLSFNPKAWWRMGDGVEANSGNIVYDMSLFSNDLTMSSAPTFHDLSTAPDSIYVA